MDGKRVQTAWIAAVCAGALTAGLEVKAQSASSAASSAANSQGMGMGMGMGMMGMGMGNGMGFMPMPYGMFGSATPSATDAAALGMTRPSGGLMGMGGSPSTAFTNPMTAPLIYGSMYPMTPQQSGMLMLAGQSQMLGIGSGQLSGVRPGPGTSGGSGGRPGKQALAKPRGSAGVPGGLAARYFNRTTQTARMPQGYYNRQNRYFPHVGR